MRRLRYTPDVLAYGGSVRLGRASSRDQAGRGRACLCRQAVHPRGAGERPGAGAGSGRDGCARRVSRESPLSPVAAERPWHTESQDSLQARTASVRSWGNPSFARALPPDFHMQSRSQDFDRPPVRRSPTERACACGMMSNRGRALAQQNGLCPDSGVPDIDMAARELARTCRDHWWSRRRKGICGWAERR